MDMGVFVSRIGRVSFVKILMLLVVGIGLSQVSMAGPKPTGADALVRGYLAIAVGGTDERLTSVVTRTLPRKDIYLPATLVFLRDPQSGKTSKETETDLSGRFSLYAPQPGRYQICWKRGIYGSGCDSHFVSAGSRPTFVSTVRILFKKKPGFVTVFGKVTLYDNSLPRTFEPAADINSYATVMLQDASNATLYRSPMNNFGEYVIPYVPVKQALHLSASVEKAKIDRLIPASVQLESAPLHRMDLSIGNSRPILNPVPLISRTTGKVIHVAQPGETLSLTAGAKDPDGDPVQFQWIIADATFGTLSANHGPHVEWTLPKKAGFYSAQLIAKDGRGGYDQHRVTVLVDPRGVPFTGTVSDVAGKPVKGAVVEVNGDTRQTDANGYFSINVKDNDRFVFNIRHPNFGFYSKIYSSAVTGGRWTLTRASVTVADPTKPIVAINRRSEIDCPGPKSAKLDWRTYRQLLQPVYLNGDTTKEGAADTTRATRLDTSGRMTTNAAFSVVARNSETKPILPTSFKRRGCGPGISVQIPANALVDDQGQPPAGKVSVNLSTVDLNSPEQMPGDDTVAAPSGYMQSYGAGSIAITGNGKRYNLRPGTQATVRIPVDPSQLATGAPLPPTIPLLYYDEKHGTWSQEGILKLVGSGNNRVYEAKVKHFSTVNSDLVKTNQACVAFQSPTLPPAYDLEIVIPMNNVPNSPPGSAPRVKSVTIDNVSEHEHVIYNLPTNTNITLVPIRTGNNPTPLGIFIVNTGQAQSPQTPNKPVPDANGHYTACATALVTLNEQAIPGAPTSPNEFLQGLNLIQSGLNAVSKETDPVKFNALVLKAQDYDHAIDPLHKRTALLDFKKTNGFVDANGNPLPGDNTAVYANGGDLGFGREMHCRTTVASDGQNDIACYVTNWGDIDTDDLDDVLAATLKQQVGNSSRGATVAMEYSRIENATGPEFDANNPDRVVKFYVYDGQDQKAFAANLDGKGTRTIPQLCMVCHGGAMPTPDSFNTTADAKLGSRFLPFDLRYFKFLSPGQKSGEQAAFKQLNQDIVAQVPAPANVDDAIGPVIAEMYSGNATTQNEDFSVAGWRAPAAPEPAKEKFYRQVVANTCRTCHISMSFNDLQLKSANEFLNKLGSVETRVCVQNIMPHALRTHDIFWTSFNPSMPAALEGFGETFKNDPNAQGWSGQLCGPYTPGGQTPQSFYETKVQPIWNASCAGGGCHIGGNAAGLSLAQGQSHGNLVNVNSTESVLKRVVPNDAASSYLMHKLNGTQGSVTANQGQSTGAQMPFGCSPPNCLSPADMNTITDWIVNHNADP